MKLYSPAAQAALESGDNLTSAAIEILCDPPFRAFGGYGTLMIAGAAYEGVGTAAFIQEVGQATGGTSQALQLGLSGVDPDQAALANEAVKDAPVTIRKLIFDGSGTILLDVTIYARGKVDTLSVDEVPGGTATITVMVETAARGLGRKGGRMRSDADQRLVNSTDGAFRAVSYAAEKTLYWGGKKPASAAAVVGGGRSFSMNANVRLV